MPQVYKPKSADVIIMRDYLHGEKVKEATLRYGQVDVHKKEVKDKAAKAARTVDKKAAARVSPPASDLCMSRLCGLHLQDYCLCSIRP